MDSAEPTADNCQRMGEGISAPEAYDDSECQDCTNWNCKFMPEGAYDEFMKGEREAMFPDGEDEGEEE